MCITYNSSWQPPAIYLSMFLMKRVKKKHFLDASNGLRSVDLDTFRFTCFYTKFLSLLSKYLRADSNSDIMYRWHSYYNYISHGCFWSIALINRANLCNLLFWNQCGCVTIVTVHCQLILLLFFEFFCENKLQRVIIRKVNSVTILRFFQHLIEDIQTI